MQNDAYIPHPPAPNAVPDGNGSVPASDATDPEAIGMVASPMRHESTSVRHFFWVPPDQLVEKTQLVHTTSEVAGRTIHYYGLVEEVYRRSRRRDMEGEVDVFDGDLSYEPPFGPEGVTYADVSILRIEPPFLTPPREQSRVYRADEDAAYRAYGYDEMRDEAGVDWGLPIGLLRNGGDTTVGVARIDLRDLKGDRAGHMNVTGQSGRGTKSSFLLMGVRSLLDFARAWDSGDPGREPFSARVIAFNVKGEDLMFIDQPNRLLDDDKRKRWQPLEQLGIAPRPFENAEFLAPCRLSQGPINRGDPRVVRPVAERQTRPYYWTLADVIRLGLWPYLFSDTAQQSEPLMALADHVLGLLAADCAVDDKHPYGVQLRPGHDVKTFSTLREWLRDSLRDKDHEASDGGIHTFATKRALLSRLGLVLDQEGRSIFADDAGDGRPLQVLAQGTPDPLVIDIAELPPELRRFVVAAVLEQVKARQMSDRRSPGQVYFLMLDELGLYAPRGARDPITRLIEYVATQLRSQGIILLGAQQQASSVSDAVFGNAEVKVLGATSPVELESAAWRGLLTPAQKSRVLMLRPDEKLVQTPYGWMNVIVPFPAWAMKRSEADLGASASANGSGAGAPVKIIEPD